MSNFKELYKKEITNSLMEEYKYQSIMDTVYANAYGILKTKYDMANEMISTLKNILKRRVSEMYINAQISGLKINNLGEHN